MLRLVLAAVLWAVPLSAAAQSLPLPIPASSPSVSPYGIPIKRVGAFDTAPVVFQGQRLFVIGAPAAAPNDTGIPPIVQRIDTINDNLKRIVPVKTGAGYLNVEASPFDAKTFTVEIGSEGGYPTLYATDGHKKDVAPIMTVTESDAALYGQSRQALATQWRAVLQTALGPAVLAVEPEYLRSQLLKVPWVLLGAIAVSLLIGFGRKYLLGVREKLDAENDRIDASDTSSAPEAKRLRLQISFLSAVIWLFTWAVTALWLITVLWLMTIFPERARTRMSSRAASRGSSSCGSSSRSSTR